MEIWRTNDGSEVAVIAATWELNPKITFESLESEFRNNPTKAWRNYGSRVDMNIESAIKDPDLLLRNVNINRSHPWNPAREEFYAWFRGQAGCRYFLHFDLSKNRDATGVAMVHRERLTKRIIVDFMLRIVVRLGQNIDYARLREHFVYGVTARGFHVERVTYDQFQSDETRQVLEEKGYTTARASADKGTEAYDTLIELLLNNRLDYYSYPAFVREMQELQYNGSKYDHPRKSRTGESGSKDVADAVACATITAITYELDNPLVSPGKIRVFPGGKALNQQFDNSNF